MILHHQNLIGTRERRVEGARIAALFARPMTYYRAAQRVLAAGASFFSSLLSPRQHRER
jgi:hypothetical protein